MKATTACSVEEADAFTRRYNGRWNIYYSLNPTRGPMNKKPAKPDIARIEYICADLDPKPDETPEAAKARYLQQLATFQPQPTAIIDSGNGIQGLWRLGAPIPLGTPEDAEKIKDAEARGKELLDRLGAATGTQNVDRILRLPGTVNLPNSQKRARGRVQCEARLISMNGVTCALEDFPKEQKKTKAGGGGGGGTQSELPRDLELMLFLTGDEPAGYEFTQSFIVEIYPQCTAQRCRRKHDHKSLPRREIFRLFHL